MPYLGGLAMVLAFSLAMLVAALLRPPPSCLGEFDAVIGMAFVLKEVRII
jgi:hypothetical protein